MCVAPPVRRRPPPPCGSMVGAAGGSRRGLWTSRALGTTPSPVSGGGACCCRTPWRTAGAPPGSASARRRWGRAPWRARRPPPPPAAAARRPGRGGVRAPGDAAQPHSMSGPPTMPLSMTSTGASRPGSRTPGDLADEPQCARDLQQRHRHLEQHRDGPPGGPQRSAAPRPVRAGRGLGGRFRAARSGGGCRGPGVPVVLRADPDGEVVEGLREPARPCAPRPPAPPGPRGRGSPWAASSATIRTACSTRWRAVGSSSAGGGPGVRRRRVCAAARTSATAAARGCRRRGRALRCHSRSAASPGGGGADGDGEPGREVLLGALAEARASLRDVRGPQAGGGRVDVGGDPPGGSGPALHERAEEFAQFADALAGDGGHGEDGGAGFAVLAEGHAVLVEEAAQVVEDLVGGVAGEPVDLVEDDEGDVGVAREGAQVALVESGVRVLLRVDDPDHGVHEGEDPVDLAAVCGDGGVVVGQVDEDESLEGLVAGAAGEGAAAQAAGDGQPVEEPGGAVGPGAGDGGSGGGPAQAGLETGTPASALMRLDLPLPVAPAMATTVWRADSRCRAAASSRTRPLRRGRRCRRGWRTGP